MDKLLTRTFFRRVCMLFLSMKGFRNKPLLPLFKIKTVLYGWELTMVYVNMMVPTIKITTTLLLVR